VLGDVITTLAQELTEYAQRIVDDVRRTVPVDTAIFDALRYLAARVEQLERAVDPLGIRPADLPVPDLDASAWADSLMGWLADVGDLPVVVGELGDPGVLAAVAATGADVDAVDPRAAVAWARRDGTPGRAGQVRVAVADVVEHLRRLPPTSRSGVVLAGCLDRAALADKVALVAAAARVLVHGGRLVLLVGEQTAWDAGLTPTLRDLLPGRPFHPDTWCLVLAHLGLDAPEARMADRGDVHAVVARRPR